MVYYFLFVTLKKHFKPFFFIFKALKDILQHFKFVNWWFRLFDVTNRLLNFANWKCQIIDIKHGPPISTKFYHLVWNTQTTNLPNVIQ